ncbi:hypothetical protein LO763_22935 [Glycomyces sp. A-F 0318]|uniref:hypothetical protein n=1 Tax=Glycomyces amatae TaxID=2881355 RepID=UPI001E33DDE9|nr:hypothetical protein [Glycomyces amatae]MCD0446476.1 hypothetical protein [Glycomyces amatae]
MNRGLPAVKRQAILEDLRERALSRNQIAKRHGVAPSTVSNVARRAGITLLTAAEAAAPGSARGRAADIALETATAALTTVRTRLDDLDPADLIRLYATTVDRYLALVGGDGPGLEHATSLLEGLAAQLHSSTPTDLAAVAEATRSDP